MNVLREDPDLGVGLDQAMLGRLERRARAPVANLPSGLWRPLDVAAGEAEMLGLLVLDGLVVRRVTLADRRSIDILGPGDLIRPLEGILDDLALVPSGLSWHALGPIRLAVLDERFHYAMAGFTEILNNLMERLSMRYAAQAQRLAIIQIRPLSARLHLLLWQLAERFGHLESGGVVLPFRLSHELLAELGSAQRPSVSRALKELRREGLVESRPEGWWLAGRNPGALPHAHTPARVPSRARPEAL